MDLTENTTKKQAYEAMILMLYDYYKSTGSTDILSGGGYLNDAPADISFWCFWEEAVEKIVNGAPPKEKQWTD